MSKTARSILWAAIVAIMSVTVCGSALAVDQGSSSAAKSLGWQVGPQAYSFKKFTFFEAVDKAVSMGMKYIEAYSKQKVSLDDDATTHWTMSKATQKKIKNKLKSAGVKLNAYGVVKGKSEAEWRDIFEFADDMGIGTITCEPTPQHMDIVEKLCDEFEINAAIHNHASPSFYWNPDVVLEAVKGRSKRVGACADTGHWMKSGLDPVECIKKLEGRVISMHLKDLDKRENMGTPKRQRTAHDVPWGNGVGNVFGVLDEARRQGFKGQISVEYEYNWDDSVPDISQCGRYLNLVAAALVEDGYKPMFNKSLSDAIFPKGSWVVEKGGVLAAKDKGDIWTKRQYADFIIDLEFKCVDDTNSGVFLRCADTVKWLHTSIEVQIQQKISDNGTHNCAAIFDCLAPTKQMIKKAGKWNRYIIAVNDNNIYVVLNGEQVLHMDLDLWTEAGKNPDGSTNKFKTAYKNMARNGHIGLQYHGHPIWFRNMKVKSL